MTARPSRVEEIMEINLPRPRAMASTTTQEFSAYVAHIRSLLSATVEF
jgi:NitT/TauT family transport system ATP-binding protein